MIPSFSSILSFIAAASAVSAALNPIVVKGNAFFDNTTNERFYIRGLDYQPGGSSATVNADPLADAAGCQRDVPYFQQLGINCIRVYMVDNSQDHSQCMALLDQAGIYLILDVNTPQFAINRASPANSYNAVYLQHIFATIDAFKGYTNVLGFFSGNEVINNVNTTQSSTWVKATTRDMKAYIKAQSSRPIPVGYSAADVPENRVLLAEYLNCGSDAASRADFYAFNQYEWCGNSTYTQSGYDQRVADFSNYSIPLFFSEFGCNLVQPRPFTEIQAIYSSQMTPVFSGGLVYEYSQETSNYGLVQINGNSVSLLQDFTNLKNEYAKTSSPAGNGGYKSSGNPSACPPNSTDFVSWQSLPALPAQASQYITGGAGKALGNNGTSMDLGGSASAPVPASTNVSPSNNGSTSQTSSSAAQNTVSANPFFARSLVTSSLFALLFVFIGAFSLL